MAKGYNAVADVLTQTADGRPLNDIWAEFAETVRIANERRQAVVDLLIFPVSNIIEDVPQFGGSDFELASEYGVPQGIRPATSVFSLGYTFDWYDLAARFTWMYLAEASAAQVESVHQAALEADNRKVFLEIMKTLFRSTNRTATINGQNYNVFALYNADGTVPPSYKSHTFDGTHNHYRVSGAVAVDSGDVEELLDDLKNHGYAPENGSTIFLLANTIEVTAMRAWRAGVVSANGAIARYDFIPALGQPGLIVPNVNGLIGQQVPSSFRGMTVVGSYGPVIIVEEDYIPAGYLVMCASGGDANLNNPIGFREHANPALRGLRLVKGRDLDYPLIDSYYQRGFGTGIRQRGGAILMQIKASGVFVAPAAYL